VTEEKKSKFTVGGVANTKPLTVIMKGGTSSSSYDKLMAKKNADAERRRAHQDRQFEVAKRQNGADGSVARLGSRKMIDGDSPRLVLRYLNRDGSIRQECISEITQVNGDKQGTLDTMFSLVCPRCLERGVPQGEAQLFVRDSHRKFSLNPAKAGPVVVETVFGRQVILVCGEVTVKDIVRCSNYNCNWSVRIEDSKVTEA
jgi:hypothetical protein